MNLNRLVQDIVSSSSAAQSASSLDDRSHFASEPAQVVVLSTACGAQHLDIGSLQRLVRVETGLQEASVCRSIALLHFGDVGSISELSFDWARFGFTPFSKRGQSQIIVT
jgi:hypothetical protein